jgi:hypothetical protein
MMRGWAAPVVVLALLGAAMTSPQWLLAFVKADGRAQRVWVRQEVPGYTWHPEEMEKGTLIHYEGCTLRNGYYKAEDGRVVMAFASTWLTGHGADLVNGPHTPDVCYPAAGGSRVASKPERVTIRAGGESFGFGRRVYRSSGGGLSLVYFIHLLGGTVPLEVGSHSWERVGLALRLRADARKDQLYMLVTTPLRGEEDIPAADESLGGFIANWVTVEEGPPVAERSGTRVNVK